MLFPAPLAPINRQLFPSPRVTVEAKILWSVCCSSSSPTHPGASFSLPSALVIRCPGSNGRSPDRTLNMFLWHAGKHVCLDSESSARIGCDPLLKSGSASSSGSREIERGQSTSVSASTAALLLRGDFRGDVSATSMASEPLLALRFGGIFLCEVVRWTRQALQVLVLLGWGTSWDALFVDRRTRKVPRSRFFRGFLPDALFAALISTT